MKLAVKLVAVVFLEIVVLLAIDGCLAVQRETRLFQSDMERDAHVLGNALRAFVAESWTSQGQQRALRLLDQANLEQQSLRVRWVWLGGADDPRYRPLAPETALVRVTGGRELAMEVTSQDGQRYFCTYIPLDVPSGRTGAIELAEPLSQLRSFGYGTAARNLVLGLVLVTVGGASVASLGIVLIGRPLHRLAEQARQIGRGDLSPLLAPRGRDELGELGRSMNDMCGQLIESQEQTRLEQERRIAAIEQLRQVDRLRTVGQLAAGVAHELGTPLNTISMLAEDLVNDDAANGEIAENARTIKSQCRRMTATIGQLLAYARPRPLRRAVTDLRQVTRDTITLLTPLAARHNAVITLSESEAACTAMVDGDQIQQVLTNLLVNALQADSAEKMPVEVNVGHKNSPAAQVMSPHQWICISVRDYGKGISADNLKHIFDPFFTTKDVGEGTGLGLSIAYGIVQEHGGWIDVTSRPGEGSCFSVYLPKGVETVESSPVA